MNISAWTFLTKLQVVVSGIPQDEAGNYTLACTRFSPYTGYTVGSEYIIARTGTKYTAVTGIANADGAAFVFADSDKWNTKEKYAFILKHTSEPAKDYDVETTLNEPERNAKIKGLKIATGGHDWARLWPGGPKWAATNIGADKPEDYGDYFAWGEIDTYYEAGDAQKSDPTWKMTLPEENGATLGDCRPMRNGQF